MIGSNEPHSPTAKTENTTPPAVPERNFDYLNAEDIAHEIWGEGTGFPPGFGPAMIDMLIAAALAAFEVRPHGTVTDAEYREAVHRAIRDGIESVHSGAADRDVVRAAADRVLALEAARDARS